MKKRWMWLALGAWMALAGFFAPSPLSAQDGSLGTQSAQEPLEELSMENELTKVLSEIQFEGGTVEEYVRLIRDLSRDLASLNIIVKEEAARIALPSIELQRVMIGTALEAMNNATSGRVLVERAGGEHGEWFLLIGRDYGAEQPGEMLVLNVRGILQELPKEKLEAVFAVGMKMLESEDLQLQLHEESGLLFAKGTPQALRMIQSAVEELMRGIGLGKQQPAVLPPGSSNH